MVMEQRAGASFNRRNMYLLCLDEETVDFFNDPAFNGIRCVPVNGVRNIKMVRDIRLTVSRYRKKIFALVAIVP